MMPMNLDITATDVFDDKIVEWLIPAGEVGYFQDSCAQESLSSWIAANIDHSAGIPNGLSIFTEPATTLNTPEWREDLLLNARKWLTAARRLAGRTSVLTYPDRGLRVIDEASTLAYIEHTAELLRFAEVVYATGSPVQVSVSHPSPPSYSLRDPQSTPES